MIGTIKHLYSCFISLAHFTISLLAVLFFAFSSLFVYWLFFDRDDVIIYGKHQSASVNDGFAMIESDAVRVRECDTIVYRKITGCLQYDIPASIAVMPLGNHVPAYVFNLKEFSDLIHFKNGKAECIYSAKAYSYCNAMQHVLRLPIIQTVGPIYFTVLEEDIPGSSYGKR